MKRRITLTTVLAVAAGSLGWWGGRLQSDSSAIDSEAETLGTTIIPKRSHLERRVETASTRMIEVEERLARLYRTHPDAEQDWRLKEETRRVLKELTAEELAELFSASVVGDFRLMREILAAWAREDGPAAIHGVLKAFPDIGQSLVHEAFGAWAQKDVEAAMAWLDQGDSPLMNKKIADNIRFNFIREYAVVDFGRVLEEIVKFKGKDRQHLLEWWAFVGEKHPQIAERLAAHLAEYPEDKMIALKGKISGIAAQDAAAALEYLSAQDVTQEQREALDFQVALEGNDGKEIAKSYQFWLERNPRMQTIPEEFWDSFQWSFTVRQQDMEKWMDGLQDGPVRNQIYNRSTRLLAARGSYDKAAAYADVISDPLLREEAAKTLGELWQAEDPAAAKVWLREQTNQ